MAEKRWGVNNSTVVFLADFIRSVLGTTDPIPGAQLDPQLREAVSKVGSGGGGGGSSADLRYVTFMDHTGTVELGKKAVAVGDDCADPIARGLFDTPTRESTAQYNYTHIGWANTPGGGWDENILKAITEDKTVYAAYAGAVRSYTITFYDSDGTTVLNTQTLTYGSTPSYTPTKDDYDFNGWTPALATVKGDASYMATWVPKPTLATMSWDEIAEVAASGNASEVFSVGDKKDVKIGNYTVQVVIVGFNADQRHDNNEAAAISFTLVDCWPGGTVSVSTTGVESTYAASNLCASIDALFTELPKDLQNAIKRVNKRSCYKTGASSDVLNEVSAHLLWAISYGEMGFKKSSNTDFPIVSNVQYPYYNSNARRIKKYNGASSEYFVRSSGSRWNRYWNVMGKTGAAEGSTTQGTQTEFYSFGFCI